MLQVVSYYSVLSCLDPLVPSARAQGELVSGHVSDRKNISTGLSEVPRPPHRLHFLIGLASGWSENSCGARRAPLLPSSNPVQPSRS